MVMRNERRDGDIFVDAIKGAIAGAVGVWALDRVTWFMWDQEDRRALQQEREARPGGLDPAHLVANRATEALGGQLSPRQPHPAGIAVHYSLGVIPGAIYGALRGRTCKARLGYGLLLGLGLFLIQDELINWTLGTSGGPTEYPWQAHARGAVGHFAYGAATETALAALDRVS